MNIQLETCQFLDNLKENNYKEWFHANKSEYLKAKQDYENFASQLIHLLQEIDPSLLGVELKQCMFRIYRDVRFSHNKEPYKTNFGCYIAKNGGRKSIHAGYYFHLGADETFFGGGIYAPNPTILKMIRKEIYYSYDEFKSIIANPSFTSFYNGIETIEALKKAPKDFPKDFEGIEILKNKHFFATHYFTKEACVNENSLQHVLEGFRAAKPLVDFFNFTIDNQEETIEL